MTEQYVTITEADSWCAARGFDDWAALEDADKGAALINAEEWIDRLYRFRGMVEDITQTRAWPRRDAFRDDGRAIMGIPNEVKDAVRILAAAFAESEAAADQLMGTASKVTQEKAGSIEVRYDSLPQRHRSKISRILMPVVVSQSHGQIRRG